MLARYGSHGPLPPPSTGESVGAVFRRCDADDSNTLDVKELRAALTDRLLFLDESCRTRAALFDPPFAWALWRDVPRAWHVAPHVAPHAAHRPARHLAARAPLLEGLVLGVFALVEAARDAVQRGAAPCQATPAAFQPLF